MGEMGRVASATKIGEKRTIKVRGRGGNIKTRALRVDHGNFSWGSEAISKKCRIIDTVYNATNNELVRTKTLVKNAVIKIDANPFRTWYLTHYDIELNKKKVEETEKARADSKHGKSSTNSPPESSSLASHPDPDNPEDVMDTSLKVPSLNSTLRKSRGKRNERT